MDISKIILALTLAGGFAVLIERLVELFKQIIDQSYLHDLRKQTKSLVKHNDEPAEPLDAELIPSADFDGDDPRDDEVGFEKSPVVMLENMHPASENEKVRLGIKVFYLVSSIGIGFVIASSMQIHLLQLLNLVPQGSNFLDQLMSGVVIAGGAQPIHLLINFITSRKLPVEQLQKTEPPIESEALAEDTVENLVTTTASIAPIQAQQSSLPLIPWTPIKYMGGVLPESLENRNFRNANPNRIIFHHTAMSDKASFKTIVDEFLVSKGWSTGYHTVIMPNGDIKPFCRWDRVGNHTKGLNNLSLGVAFHGNFHMAKGDKYSNYDGRYGNQSPTQAQLHAGARLIALWVHLYEDISLDFEQDILPHREAKPGYTVCPGSNFPVDELKSKITHFHQGWMENSNLAAWDAIQQFRHKPYLYVNREA